MDATGRGVALLAKNGFVVHHECMKKLHECTDFVRVTAASVPTAVGEPIANAREINTAISEYASSDVVLFGELSLTGYSCGDLFAQDALLNSATSALEIIIEASAQTQQCIIVGLPVEANGFLYNCAGVIQSGQLLGLVPKQFLPNYQEFYEARWFHAADGTEPTSIDLGSFENIPFGIDLLFAWQQVLIGVELCEDLWMPIPPSSKQACAGANLLLNLSASNELIGKADWREVLIRSQSGRCLAAYAYASQGPTESTTDVVFSGQCLIAENGAVLAKSQRVGEKGCSWIEHANATADVDTQKLRHDRQITNSWQIAAGQNAEEFRHIVLAGSPGSNGSVRKVNAAPFVPKEGLALDDRCAEIFGIQCASLAKRVSRLPADLPLNIGISGGLDSTLSLLVAVKTCINQGWDPERIHGITMPGFGTTSKTLSSARRLMKHLGIGAEEIDIRQLCFDTFIGLKHQPFGIDIEQMQLSEFAEALAKVPSEKLNDLVFENVQARIRTMLLMSRGFVLGTGDLSEQALGWSTYNGDHLSMYNVNTSVPKTLVRFLVKYVAEQEDDEAVRSALLDVVDTPISPELLPVGNDGEIDQKTEATLGPYELHDFFLYHMLRFGASPRRILKLASLASFSQPFTSAEIRDCLKTFITRFFNNQFKRSCVPDGPKVGSVSLSPRGDWRMPSDAEATAWLRELEELDD